MAAGENSSGKKSDQLFFLPEDIVMNILLRLPIALYIARFRCVCRSWRNLLSDPNIIRRILFFQNLADQKDLQILVTGTIEEPMRLSSSTILYSLHSYLTLSPISPPTKLPFIRNPIHSFKFIACCDGIFCLVAYPDIILWNPTTSESKILPPCPNRPHPRGHSVVSIAYYFAGFGFDPVTSDYKVVCTLEAGRNRDNGSPRLIYSEVYSLKNDSWKTVSSICDLSSGVPGLGMNLKYVHQRGNTSRNDKCYWFYDRVPKLCGILSFDMSTEVFESVKFPCPSGFPPVSPREGARRNDWISASCFMLKDSFVVTFRPSSFKVDDGPYEIWGLLKCGVAESWTKLFTFEPPREGGLCVEYWDVWKDTTYICSHHLYRDTTADPAAKEIDGVFCLDLSTGEEVGDRLEIRGTVQPFVAQTFAPSRVSLSGV
ncbi:F-box/kelch-repeat protein At3g06240 [Linum perenne]